MAQELDKKVKNDMFRVAVDYLYKNKKVGSQGELAEKIGISESSLSRIMNDKKFVSDETLRKMNEAFGGIFNMPYFRGESSTMLADDVYHYKHHPENNPFRDFDELQKKNAQRPQSQSQSPQPTAMEYSFAHEIIAVLRQQVADKDIQIVDLRADKERLIKESDAKDKTIDILQARIHELESMAKNFIDENPLENYPFDMGVADRGEKSTRV